ncbi:hypothetical protein GCM10009558_083090 [Virgisporangium aurantiacum]
MTHQHLSQFVLKIHSRCDLACDHCYIYEHADQSWRGRPVVMAPDTVRAAAERIAEHARTHRLGAVHVVLHGGEPLLVGQAGLAAILTELRARIEPVTGLDLRMQTNGVQLTEALCDLFLENDVKVGVSLDGDRAAHDRHRRYAHGGGSHAAVLAGLSLLRRPVYRRIYAGLLCTVDVANDPVAVYEALRDQRPPRIDLLLPHATWDDPPPGQGPAPYAKWLLAVHDRWVADGRPMSVRLFDSLQATRAGRASGTEAVGLDPVDLVVVEADGSWEQADSLKTAYDGAPETGLDVFRHSADEAARHPALAARKQGLAALSAPCRACPVVHQCGGGLYAHRYRTGSGFDNPSVYCSDLKELITSMNTRPNPTPAAPLDDLTDDLIDDLGTGFGSAATIGYLLANQEAITRALVFTVADEFGGAAAEGWEVLADLDERAGAAVRAVLAHPCVRAWAVRCLDGSKGDPARLCAIATAAAVRADVDVALPVPVRDGRVHLPTLGMVEVADDGSGVTVLRTAGLRVGHPTRHLLPADIEVLLEDADPFRDCYDVPVADPVDAATADGWQRLIGAAWRTIGRETPDHLPALRQGLRAVVPLLPGDGGVRSATSRHAFGAVATAPVADEDMLAEIIVHEFQHSKLGAVMDVGDLFDPAAPGTMTVGWRKDPRPVEGVLQGTYAHLAVADIWRARVETAGTDPTTGTDPAEARAKYRRYRDWTATAIEGLLGTDALTAAGRRLVQRMGEALASWRD